MNIVKYVANYFDSIPIIESVSNNCSLFLFHVNTRSLQKNFEELFETVTEFSPKPDVICLSESLIETSPVVNIDIAYQVMSLFLAATAKNLVVLVFIFLLIYVSILFSKTG